MHCSRYGSRRAAPGITACIQNTAMLYWMRKGIGNLYRYLPALAAEPAWTAAYQANLLPYPFPAMQLL